MADLPVAEVAMRVHVGDVEGNAQRAIGDHLLPTREHLAVVFDGGSRQWAVQPEPLAQIMHRRVGAAHRVDVH